MKDIDFDELDKAVNSLMASTNPPVAAAPTTEQPAAAPVAVSQPAPTAAQPNDEAPTPIAVAVTSSEPVRAAAPAIRRSGRFMDMVQKPTEPKPRPLAAPSREGVSLTPRSETSQPQPEAAQPSAPEQSVAPTPQVSNDGNMPDPLDLLQPDTTTTAVDETAPAAPAAEAPSTSIGQDSPFLTDAKVDKRPLNSEALFEPEMVSTPTTMVEPDTASEEALDVPQNESTDEPPISPSVPELDTQLVAIESGSQSTDSTAEEVKAPEASVPLGATSIAQQYTAQPSSGDQSHAAIYDASQYPEALKHPAKSKSGWLWVLWVILLLGVGAGGAVLLYRFGIIP